jgi:hypothetical protein
VLSFFKECYPLLSEAEIIKMALSNQYHLEIQGAEGKVALQDPTQRLSKAEWKKRLAVLEAIRGRIRQEDETQLEGAIDRALAEVRGEHAHPAKQQV